MSLVVVFGLSQAWVLLAYKWISEPESLEFYLIAKDGVLLFFALAITISVTMDYWFDETASKTTTLAKASVFVFYPIFVMGVIVGAYSLITFGDSNENRDAIEIMSICALSLSLIFGIIGKAFLFRRAKSGGAN